MAQLRNYGNPILVGSLGTRCNISAPTGPTATVPIQVRRYARNGKAPDSTLINRVREAANFAALYRSKQVWGGIGFDGYNCPGSLPGTTQVIHRFACHTGPYTHALYVKGVTYPPPFGATQAAVVVNVYSDAAATTLVGSGSLYYGPCPSVVAGGTFGWRLARTLTAWIDGVQPDTDYYCEIASVDNGKVGGMAIWCMESLGENGTGYLATNLTMHTPIVDSDHKQPHDILKAVWTKGGSHVFNWSSPGGYPQLENEDTNGYVPGFDQNKYITTTSTTLTNLIDRTSTTISATTPGFYLDMTYKDRVSQTSGVPCVMKVWGYSAGSGSPSTTGDGTVVLKNSAGTTIATVTGFGLTAGWVSSGAFNVPANVDKYDLQFKTNTAGVRFYISAVSIWEQG